MGASSAVYGVSGKLRRCVALLGARFVAAGAMSEIPQPVPLRLPDTVQRGPPSKRTLDEPTLKN
jgi:hypothetical protein